MDLPTIVSDTPEWLALVTTGVAAVEGAVIARQSRGRNGVSLDLVGVFVLALCLGLGGGFARDLMLGNLPVVAIRTPWYLIVVAAAALLVVAAGRFLPPLTSWGFILLDALALGLYADIGVEYALAFQVSMVGVVVVGLFASLTGGVLVALIRQETPEIMRPGFPYALLALAGILTYLALAPLSEIAASYACVGVVIVLRFVTLRWNIKTWPLSPLDHE